MPEYPGISLILKFTPEKKKSKSVGNTQITVIELIHITNTS